jgi:hypothetical protein
MATPCVGKELGSWGVRGCSARAPIVAAGAKPVSAKPADAKPIDAKPVDAKPASARPPANSAIMARPADPIEGRITSLVMAKAYANPGGHKAGGRGEGREFPVFQALKSPLISLSAPDV